MRFHSSRPQTTGEGIHWPYCKIVSGTFFEGWYAGGAVWITSHGDRPTQPCLHALTGGQLACTKCNPDARRDLLGYIPLYRATDNRPCFVIVCADQWDRVQSLRLHGRVVVGRGEDEFDRVWVRPFEGGARYQSTLAARNRPADLTDSLLRVWKIPELRHWVAGQALANTAPAELPAATMTPASDSGLSLDAGREGGGEAATGKGASAAVPLGESPGCGPASDDFAEVKNRLMRKFKKRDASKNGNGKH